MIRVMLADDQALIRAGFRALICVSRVAVEALRAPRDLSLC